MTYKLIEHSIEDIADIIGGGTPSSKVEEYYGGNIPWITPKDLSGYNDVYISKGSRNITELGLSKSSAKMLPENAVLFTSRAPIGYVAIAESQVCTNQGFKSLIPKADLLDYKFAYYLMKYYAPQIEASASGTTFKEISGGALKTFKVKIPESTETQRNIADILFKLDSKISNNTAMNTTLEKIAQRIFKSWFVDFDPVKANAEGVPFDGLSPEIQALFPNEFEESELGMIPKGWEVKSLDEIANLNTTSVKPHIYPDQTWVHYSIPSFDEKNYPVIELGSDIKSNKYAVKKNAILVSKLNPRFERTWFPRIEDELTAICSTEFMQLVMKNIDNWPYLLCMVKSNSFQEILTSTATGTTGSRQRAQPKEVIKFKVLVPNESLVGRFSSTVKSIFERYQLNLDQINSLTKIRDKLLPRLISGKITIQKAEEIINKAG